MENAVLVVALGLVAPLFAGCLADQGPDRPPATPVIHPRDRILDVLRNVAEPRFSEADAVTHWEAFVSAYPRRDYGFPTNVAASEFLASELRSAGFRTEITTVPGRLEGQIPADVRVVRGILDGADAQHRFALVAHYDTVATTTQGAYDDGAGTVAELEICKLLAKVQPRLRHSVECIFFDAEEVGLVASRAYVDAYRNATNRGFEYALVFGYDMTGINWPGHTWPLYTMIGTQNDALVELTEPFDEFLGVALHDFLGAGPLPGAAEGIQIIRVHDRNSDEQSFKRIGIPVVRFAGGRNAADYPMYHQAGDVVPYVYQYVGGRANFEKGYRTVILSSYYTIQAFDAFDPWHLPTA